MITVDKLLGKPLLHNHKEKLDLSGGTMTGELAMGANKITGVSDPTADQDAATKKYVDDNAGGGGGIKSVVAGANVTVDDTDPSNPIVAASIGWLDGGLSNSTYDGISAVDGGSSGS